MFNDTIIKLGLDNPDTWHQDIRDKFIELYSSLIDGTDYYFEKNFTDTKNNRQILELHRRGEPVRIMGMDKKVRNRELGVFIDGEYYKKVSREMEFPLKNNKKNREMIGNQKYPKNISLEEMWNVICIIIGKKEQIIEV